VRRRHGGPLIGLMRRRRERVVARHVLLLLMVRSLRLRRAPSLATRRLLLLRLTPGVRGLLLLLRRSLLLVGIRSLLVRVRSLLLIRVVRGLLLVRVVRSLLLRRRGLLLIRIRRLLERILRGPLRLLQRGSPGILAAALLLVLLRLLGSTPRVLLRRRGLLLRGRLLVRVRCLLLLLVRIRLLRVLLMLLLVWLLAVRLLTVLLLRSRRRGHAGRLLLGVVSTGVAPATAGTGEVGPAAQAEQIARLERSVTDWAVQGRHDTPPARTPARSSVDVRCSMSPLRGIPM